MIATYGRGFWILDDLAPLQQMNANVRNSNAHLFRAASRLSLPQFGRAGPSI